MPMLKKLKPKPKAFKKILVQKEINGPKLKAYAMYVGCAARRYKVYLPKLPTPIQNNIAQLWVIPTQDISEEPDRCQLLQHGKTAFLESGMHDYSLKQNELDYFGKAITGRHWFIFVLKN